MLTFTLIFPIFLNSHVVIYIELYSLLRVGVISLHNFLNWLMQYLCTFGDHSDPVISDSISSKITEFNNYCIHGKWEMSNINTMMNFVREVIDTARSWPESPVGHGWPGSLHALREPLLPPRYMAWSWPLLNVFPEDVPTSSKPIRSHLDMKCTGWPGGAVVVICWLDSDDGCWWGRSLRRGRFPSSCKIKTCISYTIIRLTRKIVKICNEINSCINTIWQVSISSGK